MGLKFYRCKHCKNIIVKVKDSNVNVFCCGEEMTELKAGTTDASQEKHVPVYTVKGNVVDVVVGGVFHPMQEEHLIEFIVLETNKGWQIKHLTSNDEPKASFLLLDGEEVVSVYEYCNLHGLWKA